MAQTEREIENNLKGLAKMLANPFYSFDIEVNGAFILYWFYEKENKEKGYVCNFDVLAENVDLWQCDDEFYEDELKETIEPEEEE